MSDEVAVVAEPNVPAPSAVSLRQEVKAQVESKSKSGDVRQRVIDDLVEKELAFVELFLAPVGDDLVVVFVVCLNIGSNLVQFFGGLRPFVQSLGKHGGTSVEQAKEKLTKIDQAIDKAINDADYQALEKIASNSSDAQ